MGFFLLQSVIICTYGNSGWIVSQVWFGTGGQGIGVLAEFVQTSCWHSEILTYMQYVIVSIPQNIP